MSFIRAVRPSSGIGTSRGDTVLSEFAAELRYPVARGIRPCAPKMVMLCLASY
jgi:hypothetical protein